MTLLQAEAGEAEPEALEHVEGDEAFEPAIPGEPVAHDASPEVADSERRPVLGSLLLRDGLVTEDELDAALAQQRLSSTRRLGEILVARGALSEAQVSRALAELGLPLEESGRRLLGRGRGCDECGGSAHQGQVRLVEVLPLTDDVRDLIAGGASSVDIEDAAVAAGMRTLREQGIGLCLEGVITTAELTGRRWPTAPQMAVMRLPRLRR